MKSPALLKLAIPFTIVFWAGFAFSQPVIRVKGSNENQLIKQEVKLFLDHLNVQENFYLTIIFSTKMPKNLKGITISDPSPEPDKYQIIRVMIDAKLKRTKQLLVLAHEMIHVKQYVKKELIMLDDKKVLWKDRRYFVSPGPNHDMPWEGEAHQADLTLVILLKSSQKQMQKILGGKVRSRNSYTLSKCTYLPEKFLIKKPKEPLINQRPSS